MDRINYIEVGNLTDGTDPTYGNDIYVTVFECGRCGSIVGEYRKDDHTRWHETIEGKVT